MGKTSGTSLWISLRVSELISSFFFVRMISKDERAFFLTSLSCSLFRTSLISFAIPSITFLSLLLLAISVRAVKAASLTSLSLLSLTKETRKFITFFMSVVIFAPMIPSSSAAYSLNIPFLVVITFVNVAIILL
ncbi:133aa long hypothetical protein [Pyrococcus horikoshii OT3]|uniref:Uncharacterized protein n=1 Tax=Pyrococcus horikoshii (strain ATCC 700860 / DSM 12428 / JCM 9974 / NBRC 100139 / OT-3) TaxID=70601 RepID=O59190_PYRHO|nr:133aa long hypothetical protein [Pyrococcus horikoshii OT3]